VEIIPVIDLKSGVVVRARMGERASYRPIETALSPTSEPLDVVRGLLSVYSFATLYIADLDAIERAGDNDAAIRQLRGEFPPVQFWVDRGIADRRAAEDWLDTELGHLVLGSESLLDAGLARHFAADPRMILSLDFRGATFQGPPALLAEPDDWPHRVIVMTLARVVSVRSARQHRRERFMRQAACATSTISGRCSMPVLRECSSPHPCMMAD
jgi:phosphoribosylformimino-5-aminoimidazole carboxamide ribotide isomerase